MFWLGVGFGVGVGVLLTSIVIVVLEAIAKPYLPENNDGWAATRRRMEEGGPR